MKNELYYNDEGYFDPTMGKALERIEKERRDKEAWMEIAKQMAPKKKPCEKSEKH